MSDEKPKFSSGGIVPGGDPQGDNVPCYLDPSQVEHMVISNKLWDDRSEIEIKYEKLESELAAEKAKVEKLIALIKQIRTTAVLNGQETFRICNEIIDDLNQEQTKGE